MSAIMVCSEDSSEKERGWTIIATKILCLSLIGVIHFQGRFWDIKLQMNCLTLSWIRSMHLNFQKVCNFLLQFRILNRLFVGCRWRFWMPVHFLQINRNWKDVSATVVLAFQVQRILLHLCWYSHRKMRMINISFFHTAGFRKTTSTYVCVVTMYRMVFGNVRTCL